MMRCRCITLIDKKLESFGAVLDLAFNFRGDVFPQIRTMRRDGAKRHKIPMVIASFCPFCGREYKKRGKSALDLRDDVKSMPARRSPP